MSGFSPLVSVERSNVHDVLYHVNIEAIEAKQARKLMKHGKA